MLIANKIEELVFYGTGDEAYELFRQTCSFCYSMNTAGYDDAARLIYEWAKEQAEHSKEWCLNEFGSLDEVDSEYGAYER